MRKASKVALVGWWPANRYKTPWDDPDMEIWGVNEAANKPWMKRWDRMFQMHGRWNFSRLNNPNDPNHFEWLKTLPGPESPDYRPVYMQMGWTDIPASVAFPKDAIEEEYLRPYHKRIQYPGGVEDLIGVRMDGKGYFSSSAAYMISLAMLEGFEEIHMYGFTMKSGTEYQYQRENGSFWLGQAMGRKHKIVLPDPCNLLTASGLYGYEVTEMIGRQDLEFRLEALDRIVETKKAMLNTINGAEQGIAKTIEKHPELAETLTPELELYGHQKEAAMNELWSATGARFEVQNWIKTIDLQPTDADFGEYVMGTSLEEIKRKEGEAVIQFGRDFGKEVPHATAEEGPSVEQ